MLLTQQKPTQPDRVKESDCQPLTSDPSNGEVREGLPGSTLERGMREENRQEPGRPCRLLITSMMRLDNSHGIRLVSPHKAKAWNR